MVFTEAEEATAITIVGFGKALDNIVLVRVKRALETALPVADTGVREAMVMDLGLDAISLLLL